MGKEIDRLQFGPGDFQRFQQNLEAETARLGACFREGRHAADACMVGFELEAWLLDRHYFPVAGNDAFLDAVNDPLVVPELSAFNIELNGTPRMPAGHGLRRMEEELAGTWRRCVDVARELESTLVMIGTLPTLREGDLSLETISRRNRYYALNEQILRLRRGRPLGLHIRGRDVLDMTQSDVMLEAAATSFQVHLQVPWQEAARHYNASLLLSAPMVALTANSPFLFGRSLWDETRIPVFEQSADTGVADRDGLHRVTFGSGYLGADVMDYFLENVASYPVMLPMHAGAAATLPHLRLHNGTIWRWNRMLVGFDAAGRPALRIEHRVMPAGPTLVDMMANAAVYCGATCFLAGLRDAPEQDLPFVVARENFYRAARDGLAARVRWLDGREVSVRTLLGEEILPMAREGLILLGVDRDDAHRYLDLARARVRNGQNGAHWQREHAAANGHDFHRLTADYLARQRSGTPVHEWEA